MAEDVAALNKNITVNAILPDSFQTRQGVKSNDYLYITGKILKQINRFILGSNNGKMTVISSTQKKFAGYLKANYNLMKKFITL